MKKKAFVIILSVAVLVGGCAIWYQMPVDLMELDAEDVSEIHIFNGNNGQEIKITDSQTITPIIENLNEITLKRNGLSLGVMGYSFRIRITLSDGKKAEGWEKFTINASDSVRKDPFFYKVVKGKIDHGLINRQFAR